MLARPSSAAARIVAALDTADLSRAEALAEALAPPRCGVLKVGLELFGAAGPEAVRRIGARGAPVFLDLKLHDIPNTVAGAVRALLPLRPAMLTLHAAGGAAMVEAARKAAQEAGEARPLLLAVTVLTSLDAGALAQTGVADPPQTQVLRLARLALDNGADGLV
ncbi:MAG TPA: orotidine-5'-phosphate decarboxylase, partial [Acetobacteraceae bacterium]|nr:orotidine-5'-phosphate decarboxylase [Acetobacteraceae bacterium]